MLTAWKWDKENKRWVSSIPPGGICAYVKRSQNSKSEWVWELSLCNKTYVDGVSLSAQHARIQAAHAMRILGVGLMEFANYMGIEPEEPTEKTK